MLTKILYPKIYPSKMKVKKKKRVFRQTEIERIWHQHTCNTRNVKKKKNEVFPTDWYDTRKKLRATQRNEEYWNGKYSVKYKSHFSNSFTR